MAWHGYTKYRAKKTMVDGISFSSKLEADRYIILKKMEKDGLIHGLELQKEFILIPSFRKNGRTYRKTSYFADFSYFRCSDEQFIIEDTKGFKTEVYKLKRKMFEERYPDYTITEVKR